MDDREAIIDWFAGLSLTNQFAAGVDPSGWANAQATGDKADMRDELERRAKVWQSYMRDLAEATI